MDQATGVRILDEAVCISLNINTRWIEVNSIIFRLTLGK